MAALRQVKLPCFVEHYFINFVAVQFILRLGALVITQVLATNDFGKHEVINNAVVANVRPQFHVISWTGRPSEVTGDTLSVSCPHHFLKHPYNVFTSGVLSFITGKRNCSGKSFNRQQMCNPATINNSTSGSKKKQKNWLPL